MYARVIIFSMVSTVGIFSTVIAGDPRSDSSLTNDRRLPPRPVSALQVDVHSALRAEAISRRQGPNPAEVVRLIDLYGEMAAHPKRDQSVVLTKLGLQVRSRLEKVCDYIKRQSARQIQTAKNSDGCPADASPEVRVLAQQIAVPGGAGQGAQPAANQVVAARTIDYGPELVELIEQVISPATWDINGGNGSIAYFAQAQALVVNAPGTVHAQIVDLLGQLRAAP